MKVIYSDKQRLHRVKYEFLGGEPTPCFEKPERADMVLNAINSHGGFEVIEPQVFGVEPMKWVHTEDYVAFLGSAGMNGKPVSEQTGMPRHTAFCHAATCVTIAQRTLKASSVITVLT